MLVKLFLNLRMLNDFKGFYVVHRKKSKQTNKRACVTIRQISNYTTMSVYEGANQRTDIT